MSFCPIVGFLLRRWWMSSCTCGLQIRRPLLLHLPLLGLWAKLLTLSAPGVLYHVLWPVTHWDMFRKGFSCTVTYIWQRLLLSSVLHIVNVLLQEHQAIHLRWSRIRISTRIQYRLEGPADTKCPLVLWACQLVVVVWRGKFISAYSVGRVFLKRTSSRDTSLFTQKRKCIAAHSVGKVSLKRISLKYTSVFMQERSCIAV